MPNAPRLVGPRGQLYADPQPIPGALTFHQDNTSADYYLSPYYLAHKNQVQPIPPRHSSGPVQLGEFIPTTLIEAIRRSGQISFHAAADTGVVRATRRHVADAMAEELQLQGAAGPAFLFNLGDVIYHAGEAQGYYEQFYEPFRGYDRPIFAVPGDHDAIALGSASTAAKGASLGSFLANFCAQSPGRSPDAPGIMRSVMTQPGVYFTLEAPFVSIIGLYSNALEGPGVLSSQGGHYPVSDEQLTFLKSELSRLKGPGEARKQAIVLAVHHPPLSIDGVHGGSTGLATDLHECFTAAGVWPDLVLSGHAHLYQRFTHRTSAAKEIPFIVAGSGGSAELCPVAKLPAPGTSIGPDRLEITPIAEPGFLTITSTTQHLSVAFHTASAAGLAQRDLVTVDLVRGRIRSGGGANHRPARSAPPRMAPRKSRVQHAR
jgi:hypothetical protein